MSVDLACCFWTHVTTGFPPFGGKRSCIFKIKAVTVPRASWCSGSVWWQEVESWGILDLNRNVGSETESYD